MASVERSGRGSCCVAGAVGGHVCGRKAALLLLAPPGTHPSSCSGVLSLSMAAQGQAPTTMPQNCALSAANRQAHREEGSIAGCGWHCRWPRSRCSEGRWRGGAGGRPGGEPADSVPALWRAPPQKQRSAKRTRDTGEDYTQNWDAVLCPRTPSHAREPGHSGGSFCASTLPSQQAPRSEERRRRSRRRSCEPCPGGAHAQQRA